MNEADSAPPFAVVSGAEYQAMVLAHVLGVGRRLPPLIWRVDSGAVSGQIVGRDDQDVLNRAKAWAEAFKTSPTVCRWSVSAVLVTASGEKVVIAGRLGEPWRRRGR